MCDENRKVYERNEEVVANPRERADALTVLQALI